MFQRLPHAGRAFEERRQIGVGDLAGAEIAEDAPRYGIA
jgi:hypothetical protein